MNWVHVRNLVQAHVLAAEALTAAKGYVAVSLLPFPHPAGCGQGTPCSPGDSWLTPISPQLKMVYRTVGSGKLGVRGSLQKAPCSDPVTQVLVLKSWSPNTKNLIYAIPCNLPNSPRGRSCCFLPISQMKELRYREVQSDSMEVTHLVRVTTPEFKGNCSGLSPGLGNGYDFSVAAQGNWGDRGSC